MKLKPFSKYFLFWSWNLIFVLLIAFIMTEHVIIPIIIGVIKDSVPLEEGFFSLLIFCVPFIAIAIAVTKRFRCDENKLLQLFFGIELPVFFLAMARILFMNELQAAMIFLIIVALIAIVAYGVHLFSSAQEKTNTRLIIELSGLSVSLIFSIYVALVLLFFSIPIIAYGVMGFLDFQWVKIFSESPLAILGAVFVVYTMTLFAGLPIMMCVYHIRSFWRQYCETHARSKNLQTPAIAIGICATCIVLFSITNHQPQAEAIALLAKPATTDVERKALLEQSHKIRSGLINAYLKDLRYADTTEHSRVIKDLYSDAFNLNRSGLPTQLQTLFNQLAAPFFFNGGNNHYRSDNIAKLYENFFDAPIEKQERYTIRTALKSKWQRDGVEAGLIDSDREKVWIEKQALNIEEFEHTAKITLQETYRNHTYQRQEILYHFSLPEEAVLTGIWLSDDENDLKKYAYSVAPRGAAQQIYKQEMQRRIDPALLEQVGPYQYRLRIFPIPQRTSPGRYSINTQSPAMFMQFQYIMPMTDSFKWMLPTLLEKRNAFWTADTTLTVNGANITRSSDQWLPTSIPAKQSTPLNEQTISFDNTDGVYHIMQAKKQPGLIASHTGKHFAVLIDTSYSMHKQRNSLATLLKQLQKHSDTSATKIDYFLVGKQLSKVEKPEVKQILFFGHSGHLTHLQLWQQRPNKEKYDAVVLVTDDGAYEIQENIKLTQDVTTPIWLLHLNNQVPYAYDDKLFDLLLKSRGGITTRFETVLQQSEKTNPNIHFSGGYEWEYKGSSKTKLPSADANLSPIAARQYIHHAYQQHKASSLKTLDSLHKIAQHQSIVTPFSSMIVLVNTQQKEELEKMSQQQDRFDREVEGSRKLSNQSVFSAQGVPEPEEWALIVVASLLLISAYIRRRRQLWPNNVSLI